VIAGLGAPVQVAYAVADVDTAAHHWASLGAGPFHVARHILLRDVRVRGRPGRFDHSSAYGQWGSIMVELVQLHSGGPGPTHGIHHLAFLVPDLAAALAEASWPVALWASTAGGQAFAFLDATADLGHYVELYEPSPRLLGFYRMVASAAEGWDGADPVRELTATPPAGAAPQ
jgi:hypothetical protein